MIKIRLSRRGAKNSPFYRIVAIDERKKREGATLDNIGTWDPKKEIVEFDRKKYEKWLGVGAKPTRAVSRLIKK